MSVVWDSKIPSGIRFKVTKTTKGRLGVIIGEHKFRKYGVHNDGTQIFRVKEMELAVNLDQERVSDASCAMESSIERFMEQHMEQRVEHFNENNANNHLDHVDQNVDLHAHVGGPRCEVTMNNQGGDKLHFNGYSYSKKAISANAIRWTCATPTRSVIRCKGAITTDRERPYSNPRSLVLHNHPPEDPEASIMRDIARAKRRLYRRKVYQHPFQFYPWMYPLQQLHGQSGERERNDVPAFSAGTLEAALTMGGAPRADPGAGPSGYLDDSVKVKMEPEWVDAGALEPNCELEGQFEETQEFNSVYQEDDVEGPRNDQNYSPVYGARSQPQQPTMVPDARDPVKLHVPGKPNLTITVAPPKPPSASSSVRCPPLNILNPIVNRKRGRPRGSAYGSYNENEDRVTTILTDSIIASQKMEKLERSGATYQSPVAAAMSSPVPGQVKPRSKDPEAVRAAQIVNNTQNRTGSREELEKVCLKLRQEVLALEVQNLKAEREKLAAYRRNIAVRREIMKLHLQLESGIPSECASSGRGFNTVDTLSVAVGAANLSAKNGSTSMAKAEDCSQNPKASQEISMPASSSTVQAKISVRKSLQVSSSHSSNLSDVTSAANSPKHAIIRPNCVAGERTELPEKWEGSEAFSHDHGSSREEILQWEQEREENSLHQGDGNELHQTSPETETPSHLEEQDSGDDLSMLDSVSPDLSVEYISDPGSRQWTQSSSVDQERFDPQFEESSYEDTYTNNSSMQNSLEKKPPDGMCHGDDQESNVSKRRRVENMWEPDNSS